MTWSYKKQINFFYRIEDDATLDKNGKPRIVGFMHSEADAKLICSAVNAYTRQDKDERKAS